MCGGLLRRLIGGDQCDSALCLLPFGQILSVTVQDRSGEKYDGIIGYRLGPQPPGVDSEEDLPECVPREDREGPF